MNHTVDIDDVLARIIDEQEQREVRTTGVDPAVPHQPAPAIKRRSFAPARALAALAAERSRIRSAKSARQHGGQVH
jgi:hypothetical protein